MLYNLNKNNIVLFVHGHKRTKNKNILCILVRKHKRTKDNMMFICLRAKARK